LHRDAAYAIDRDKCEEGLWRAACEDWDEAVRLGQEKRLPQRAVDRARAHRNDRPADGLRHHRGFEPDFALVKFKKLAGGGYFKIVNQSVPEALKRLGYAPAAVQEIVAHVSGYQTRCSARPHVNRASLKARGLADDDLAKIENTLLGSFELDLAFGPWVLGEEAYARLGVPAERMRRPGFSLLSYLGFSRSEIRRSQRT